MTDATQKIATAVLAYLAENPDAQDTLEGIKEWWPLGQGARPRITSVKAALRDLVQRGLVLERKGKDAGTYYKVNRRRLKEIKALLASPESPDAPHD